jgi:hypothetical protein
MKERLTWKCEQIGGYPLCNCERELITTTTTPPNVTAVQSSSSSFISKTGTATETTTKQDLPTFSALLVCAGQAQTLDCKTEPIRLVEAFEYVSTLNVCEYK